MPSPIQLVEGQVFARDFRVIRPLSSGGMGSVYVVSQVSTGAERALKLMHRELVADAKQRARFEQEAKVGSSIRSDHVVKVISAGIDDESGLPFLVMELLEGQELEAMIVQRGPLPPSEVALIFSQLCHALAAAHVAGVVHRDLKPENIFIATSQRADVPFTVKILDFGIAKVVAESQATAAATQSLGTPLYMAPEQSDWRAKIVPATDIWAVGLIAFRLLTGKFFWRSANGEGGATLQMIMAEVFVSEIPPASSRATELGVGHLVPRGFDMWFSTCLTRDAAGRFANAGDAWRSLAVLLGAATMGTTPAGGPTVQGMATVVPTQSQYGATPIPAYAATAVPTTSAGVPPTNVTGYAPPPGHSSSGSLTPQFAPAPPPRASGPGARKSRGAIYAVAGVALVGAIAVGGWAVVKSNTSRTVQGPKVTLCANALTKNLTSTCDGELTAAAQTHRSLTYRITQKDGRVTLVERINGAGRLVEDENGVAVFEFEYASGPVPTKETWKDHLGQAKTVLVREKLADDEYRDSYQDVFGTPKRLKKTRAVAVVHKLDASGYQITETLWNARKKPTMTAQRVYGYKSERDAKGHQVAIIGLDPSGKPMRTDQWMASIKQTFDAMGNGTSGQFLDENGVPMMNSLGVSGFTNQLDEFGNVITEDNLSADGRPVPTTRGYASLSIAFDEHGNVAKVTFVDPNKKPVLTVDGMAGWNAKFDDHGNEIERAYFDANGKPTTTKSGIAKTRSKYDDRDLVVSYAMFDASGKPFPGERGAASYTMKYDARGNRTEERYLDVDGKPVRLTDWTSIMKYTYDDHDRTTVELSLDPAGEPTRNSLGYAKRTFKYDVQGNVAEEAYFDESGAPTGGVDGVARIVRTYDELGDRITEALLDEQGKPFQKASSFATLKAVFDDNGAQTDIEYFGLDGKPVLVAGAAAQHEEHDMFGNTVQLDKQGLDGPSKPVTRTKQDFDTRNLAVVASYFGPDGAPAPISDKIAAIRRKYDERGNKIEERWLGVDGKPVLSDGQAGFNAKYDVFGRRVAETSTGLSGESLLGSTKFATQTMSYDAWGRLVQTKFFGVNGEPVVNNETVAVTSHAYDTFGNELELRVFGLDDKPTLNASGYHAYLLEYDARGNRIKSTFLDKDGKPSKDFLIATYTFDERDKMTEKRLTQNDGTPGVNADNASLIKFRNDDQGHLLEEAFFGKDGKAVLDRNQVAVRRFKYDSTGRLVETSCFGTTGTPTTSSEGFSIKRLTYGPDGAVAKTELLSTAGTVIRTIEPPKK